MFSRLMGSTTPRRAATLAAVLTVAAMMSTTRPASADTVRPDTVRPDKVQAASGAGRTVHLSAHTSASKGIGTQATPLDITCDFSAFPPIAVGNGLLDSSVVGDATTLCTFDATGQPATVTSMGLDQTLWFNSTRVNDRISLAQGSPFVQGEVRSAPCRAGLWENQVFLHVTWPAGYNPPNSSATVTIPQNITLCPGDGKRVPNIIGMSVSDARSAVNGAGLVIRFSGSVLCVDPQTVFSQSPSSGTLLPPGSTVTANYDSGDPHKCVIK